MKFKIEISLEEFERLAYKHLVEHGGEYGTGKLFCEDSHEEVLFSFREDIDVKDDIKSTITSIYTEMISGKS